MHAFAGISYLSPDFCIVGAQFIAMLMLVRMRFLFIVWS